MHIPDCDPFTVDDWKKLNLKNINNTEDFFLEIIIMKALDEHGKNLFTESDKQRLKKNMSAKLIASMAINFLQKK